MNNVLYLVEKLDTDNSNQRAYGRYNHCQRAFQYDLRKEVNEIAISTSDSEHVFLFDSVTDLPLETPAFDDEDIASYFLDWTQRKTRDLRSLSPDEIKALRSEYFELVTDPNDGEVDWDKADKLA